MQTFPMTLTGAKQLEDELLRLKMIERPQVIQAIAEARSHGDLSENAEYSAAKEKQSFIEGRIADIEFKLARAQVIDSSTIDSNGRIIFGAVVHLLDLETDVKITYQIVGDDEAEIKDQKISVNSIVGRSLIGKEVGSIVEVKVPSGIKEYEILHFTL